MIEDKDYIDKCKLDIEMSGFKYITSEAFMQQMIAITTSTPLICTEVRDSSTNEAHINFDCNACSQPKILKKFVKTIKAHVIIRSRSFPDASIISNDQSTIGMKAYLDLVVPRLKVHLMEEEKMRHLNLVVKRDMESKEEYLIEPWKCIIDTMHLLNRTITVAVTKRLHVSIFCMLKRETRCRFFRL